MSTSDFDPQVNRFGVPTGSANERVMFEKVGNDAGSSRTVFRSDGTGGVTMMKTGAGFVRFTNESSSLENQVFRPSLSGIKFFTAIATAVKDAFYTVATILKNKTKPLLTATGHISRDGMVIAYQPPDTGAADGVAMVPAKNAPFFSDENDSDQLYLIFGEAVDGAKNVVFMPSVVTEDGAVFGQNVHGKLWLQSHVYDGANTHQISGGPQADHPHVDTLGVAFPLPAGPTFLDTVAGRSFLRTTVLYGAEKYYGVGAYAMEIGFNCAVTWVGEKCYFIKATLSVGGTPSSDDFPVISTASSVIYCNLWVSEVSPNLVRLPNGAYSGTLPEFQLGSTITKTNSQGAVVAWAVLHITPSGQELGLFVHCEPESTAAPTEVAVQGYRQSRSYDKRVELSSVDGVLLFSNVTEPSAPGNTSELVEGNTLSFGTSWGVTYEPEGFSSVVNSSGIPWVCSWQMDVIRYEIGTPVNITATDGYDETTFQPAIQFYGQPQKFMSTRQRVEYNLSGSSSTPNPSGAWTFNAECVYDANTNTIMAGFLQKPVWKFSVVSAPSVFTNTCAITSTKTVTTTVEYAGISLASATWVETTTYNNHVTVTAAELSYAYFDGYLGYIVPPGTSAVQASGGPYVSVENGQKTTTGEIISGVTDIRISNNLVQVSWTVSPVGGASQNYYALISPNGLVATTTTPTGVGRASWNPITGAIFYIVGDTDQNYDTWC